MPIKHQNTNGVKIKRRLTGLSTFASIALCLGFSLKAHGQSKNFNVDLKKLGIAAEDVSQITSHQHYSLPARTWQKPIWGEYKHGAIKVELLSQADPEFDKNIQFKIRREIGKNEIDFCDSAGCQKVANELNHPSKFQFQLHGHKIRISLSDDLCSKASTCKLKIPTWSSKQLIQSKSLKPVPSEILALTLANQLYIIDVQNSQIWAKHTMPGPYRVQGLTENGKLVLNAKSNLLVLDIAKDQVLTATQEEVQSSLGLEITSDSSYSNLYSFEHTSSEDSQFDYLGANDQGILFSHGFLDFGSSVYPNLLEFTHSAIDYAEKEGTFIIQQHLSSNARQLYQVPGQSISSGLISTEAGQTLYSLRETLIKKGKDNTLAVFAEGQWKKTAIHIDQNSDFDVNNSGFVLRMTKTPSQCQWVLFAAHDKFVESFREVLQGNCTNALSSSISGAFTTQSVSIIDKSGTIKIHTTPRSK